MFVAILGNKGRKEAEGNHSTSTVKGTGLKVDALISKLNYKKKERTSLVIGGLGGNL